MKKTDFGYIRKAATIVSLIVAFIIFYSQHHTCVCKKRIDYSNVALNRGLDLDTLYLEVTPDIIAKIRADWDSIRIKVDSFSVVAESNYVQRRRIQIYVLYTGVQKHYGALIYPENYEKTRRYPSIFWAEGLNQHDPSVSIESRQLKSLARGFNEYFMIVPSYRGQALVYDKHRYCSDGFFGDAYDGAATDALRLLSLVKHHIKSIDRDQVSVIGVSRGGTVALLMGARDTSIRRIASIAGPTDFYSKEIYNRYGKQYKYQFLSTTKDISQIRKKMIKSSPLHFYESYPKATLIIHGRHDRTVRLSQVQPLIDLMNHREHFEYYIYEGGHYFDDWPMVVRWIKKM